MINDDNPLPKLVFLIGYPRSGTTWLMWLLSHHPEIVGCNHAGFFHAIRPLETWWTAADKFGKNVHIFTGDGQGGEQYQRLHLKDALADVPPRESFRAAGWDVFRAIARTKPGAGIVLEQTPENMLFTETILNVFPEAYFLHAIRDPRAIVASMREAVETWANPLDFLTNPVQIAGKWSWYQELGRSLAARTPNYRAVQYEALKGDGISTLMGIFDWLGIACTEELARAYLEASTLDRMKSEEGLMPRGFFRKGKAQGWQEELSAGQVRAVEHIAGDWMKELGYERVYLAGRVPPAVRRYHFGLRVRTFFSEGTRPALKKAFQRNRALKWALTRVRSIQLTLQRMK